MTIAFMSSSLWNIFQRSSWTALLNQMQYTVLYNPFKHIFQFKYKIGAIFIFDIFNLLLSRSFSK
jgi:hypothetical protein